MAGFGVVEVAANGVFSHLARLNKLAGEINVRLSELAGPRICEENEAKAPGGIIEMVEFQVCAIERQLNDALGMIEGVVARLS